METKISKVSTLKVEEKKPEVKAVTPEVKAEKEQASKKTTVKKTTTKTATAKKTAVKTTAAKTTAAKTAAKTKTTVAKTAEKKVNMFIQYQGSEFNSDGIVEKVKAAVTAETGKKTFKTLDIYVKPEEGVAYYVVNGKPGSVQM